jgi:Flp pilus assembly secretin CpaC
MKNVLILTKNMHGLSSVLLIFLCLFLFFKPVTAGKNAEIVKLKTGQSEILEYMEPVKRVSISDPKIADATVTSPHQILLNGKTVGNASMIVWDERENHIEYKLIVQNEVSEYKIRLRVRFAEVKQAALREFGINFLISNKEINNEIISAGSFAGKVNSPSIPLSLSETVDFFLAVPTQDFQAIVQAMEQNGILTTLAKPSLTAADGEEASFLAGGEFPVPVAQGGIGGQSTVTIQWKEFGIGLKFTPTVLDSNHIYIKLSTEVSSLDFENGVTLSGFRVPSLVSRKSETTVELQHAENFVIGGLISSEMAKSTSQVPFLGSIPILGELFKSTTFQNRESELIIMITPHLVRSSKQS